MPFQATLSEQPTASEVRDQLHAAGEYAHGLMQMAPEQRGQGYRDDVRSAVDFINTYDPIYSAFERFEAAQVTASAPAAATLPLSNQQFRTAGDLLTTDEGYERSVRQTGYFGANYFQHELRGSLFAHNDEFRATVDSTTGQAGVWRPVGQPADAPVRYRARRMFLRDLLAVQGTGLSSVPYIREVNAAALEGGASAVAEASAKPEVALAFAQDDAPVRKIAAWIPATEEALMDAPTLRGYIDTRLAYMLAIREEALILNGSGTAPEIKGLLQFTVQTRAAGADVPTTLGMAIGDIEMVDGEPDAIVMNPLKFWTAVTTRYANQFDGGFGATAIPYGNAPAGFWGLPTIRTRALSLNQAIVGNFALGATLFDRMQTTIKVGNQHSDWFTKNMIAILAEERVALAVHRPDFFVNVTLP